MASYASELAIKTASQVELPFGVSVHGSAGALWKHMKAWRNDGCDMVTAGELWHAFGQVSIEHKLGDAFKEQVRASRKTIVLQDLISLMDGPTESLSAAFSTRSDRRLFSMVVQLSFLAYIHKADSLAAAITSHYEAKGQQDQQLQTPPCQDQQQIRTVIECCQEQTVAWNWEPHLAKVADILGIVSRSVLVETGDGLDGHGEPDEDTVPNLDSAKAAIDGTIFRGLIDFLPEVFRRPEDRTIEIKVSSLANWGMCAVIVWAHYVLDMSILVRTRGGNFCFPKDSTEHSLTIIALEPGQKTAITLFTAADCSTEQLFTIQPDEYLVPLESTQTTLAKGFGTESLRDVTVSGTNCDEVVKELILTACVTALHLADHLEYINPAVERAIKDGEPTLHRVLRKPNVAKTNLIKAAEFLFGPDSVPKVFSLEAIDARKYLTSSLDDMPTAVKSHFRASKDDHLIWSGAYNKVQDLAVLLLAVCHVETLDQCDGLVFNARSTMKVPLRSLLRSWNGIDRLKIETDTWFRVVYQYIDEDAPRDLSEGVALVSRRGWSIHVNTLGTPDPSLVQVGRFFVRRGVPCRHGVRKRNITDDYACTSPFVRKEFATFDVGETVSLAEPPIAVQFEPTMIGQQSDAFTVRMRFTIRKPMRPDPYGSLATDIIHDGTSHKQLSDSIWCMHSTESCVHGISDPVELDKATAFRIFAKTYGGYLDTKPHVLEGSDDKKMLIFPSAGDKARRWYTLYWLFINAVYMDGSIMLQSGDCCTPCAIQQTSRMSGLWFLIT